MLDSEAIALKHEAEWGGQTQSCSEKACLVSLYSTSRRKRLFDVVFSLFIILVTSPLLLTVFLLVAVTTRGPVIYRQTRHGAGKNTFSIYKFRTMYDRPAGAPFVQTTRDDHRITPLGRILRRTSVDEMPQFFNVLRGEMSIVGPRPHPVPLDQMFDAQIDQYDQRFRTRPGITGLAQVRGARGETPTLDHMRRRVELDLTYIADASLRGDIRILIATVRELLASPTAF